MHNHHQTVDPLYLASLHENHIHRGAGKTYVKDITEQSIKEQLLLGDDRNVNEALKL
jgi:hypothetical protein